MSVNAREERFESIELLGKPALFTNSRINRATVPEGFYCYDLRGSDYDPGKPVTVEKSVAVNHAATVLTAEPIKFQKDKDFRRINHKMDFLGESVTLAEFCEQHELTLQPDNRKFLLRPASLDEVGLFYSQTNADKDAELATVGHLRMDFGNGGKEFWSTWWPHNDDALCTSAFKAELDEFVNELRNAVRTSSVGDYTVTASGVNSKNYTITFEDGTLTIEPRPITVTADSKKQEYGEKEVELTYTLSEKEVDPENNPLVVTLDKPDGKDVNAYIITVDAENKNYDITTVPGIYIITPAPLVITVKDAERPHGAENPKFEVTYEGFKNGEDNKVLEGELVFKTDATPGSGGGKYVIIVSGVSSPNYSILFKDGTLTVKNPAAPAPEPAPEPAPAPAPAKPKKPASGNPTTGNGFLETYPAAAPLVTLLAASTAAGAWMLGKKRKKKTDESIEQQQEDVQ